jgi:hypothetical protein
MTPVGTLAAIVLIPMIFLMVLRVNATLVFLSLCLGNILTQFVAGDTNDLLGMLSTSHATGTIHATDNGIKLALLLFPVVLTAIFMIRTVNGNSRLFLNLLPAAGVGLLGSLLVVPLLPPGLAHNIVDSSLWDQLVKAQDLIVGSTALICLFVLWLQRPKTGEGKHGKHKG